MHRLMISYKDAVAAGDREKARKMDTTVHALASGVAFRVNEEGPQAQLEFLMANAPMVEVESMLKRLMAEV